MRTHADSPPEAAAPSPPASMPGDDILHLADRLRPALLRLSRQMRDAQRSGVSVLDAQLLFVIKTEPGVSASELAEQERVSRPTMSAHLKRLEDAGWIARQPPGEDDDRRRQGLELTRRGWAALQDVRRRRTDWLAARLAALAPEERLAVEAALPALIRLMGEGR